LSNFKKRSTYLLQSERDSNIWVFSSTSVPSFL